MCPYATDFQVLVVLGCNTSNATVRYLGALGDRSRFKGETKRLTVATKCAYGVSEYLVPVNLSTVE